MDRGHAAFRHGSPSDRDLSFALLLPSALKGEVAAWRALAARAADPSPLHDPDATLAAIQHLPGGRDVAVAVVRQGGALLAAVPLRPSRAVLAGGGASVWSPDPLPELPPLVAAERTVEALEALLDGLAAAGRRFARLTLPALSSDGPIALALAGIAARSGRRLVASERDGSSAPLPEMALAARRRELRGALSAAGAIRLERARDPREIRDAVETLLALDALGATRDRPALIADPGAASFLRTASRGLAAARRARVDVLRLDGSPVAAAIVVGSGSATGLWRLAADPERREAPELLGLEVALAAIRSGGATADLRREGPPLSGAAPRTLVDLTVEARPARLSAWTLGPLAGFRARPLTLATSGS